MMWQLSYSLIDTSSGCLFSAATNSVDFLQKLHFRRLLSTPYSELVDE
jgi:hypothetical protein